MQTISKLIVRAARISTAVPVMATRQLVRAPLLSAVPRFNFSEQKAKAEEEPTENKTEANPEQDEKAKKAALEAEEKALPNTVEELLKVGSELSGNKIVSLFNQLKESKAKLETQYKLVAEEKTAYQNQTTQWQEKAKEMKKIVEQTVADMDNMRIRLEKEKDQMKVFAITKFAGEVLEVNDNIDRALQANKDLPDKETNTLYEGTLMTQKILDKILERNGVVKLNPEGEKFDPNMHDALCQVPDATKEAGSVAFVAQTGYKIKDRVLRPAKVGVTFKP